jgi:hypothetical protein
MNGYNDPEFIILENQGIDPRSPYHGTRYLCYKEGGFYHHTDAFSLKHITQKADNLPSPKRFEQAGRIQIYVIDETKSLEEVARLKADAAEKEAARKAEKESAEEER